MPRATAKISARPRRCHPMGRRGRCRSSRDRPR